MYKSTQDKIQDIVLMAIEKNKIHSAEIGQVLVLTRVLLEENNLKKTFPTVNRFGNWLVHSELSEAKECFEILDSICEVILSGAKNNSEMIPTEVSNIIGTKNLRNELKSIFNQFGVGTCLIENDDNWSIFIMEIVKEIIGRPIAFPRDVTETGNRACDKIFAGIIKKAKGVDFYVPIKVSLSFQPRGEFSDVYWKIETKHGSFILGHLS